MNQREFDQQVHILSVVAAESVDESDAVSRHPEVIDALMALAGCERLNEDYFGGNGHDPNGFAATLAGALKPYRSEPLEDPELVHSINFFAWALQGQRSEEELKEMELLA
jgi:hypothetical protein